MPKKYEFTGEERNGLKQIRRLSDGVIGGWLEHEGNLSHDGYCWVGPYASVRDDAYVFKNAQVIGAACVSEFAVVHGYCQVRGNAAVRGRSCVMDSAIVEDIADVSGSAMIGRTATVRGASRVSDLAVVYGIVEDGAVIGGDAEISYGVKISGSVFINGSDDFWHTVTRDGGVMVWTKSNNMLRIGCMYHTVEEWWAITIKPIADKYPIATRIFRERFAYCMPDNLIARI